ncbi:hypothetical protein GIB67_016222 [Kingdonia uniflora]|uniref:MULE transposase domain-containing protein n=1 Tax=Kingdonia uniflora TaxID=39325 RepID=A0A7J7LSY5_9MAGN|nr:hypothetical protein GIB67_016222 [Kingdonia uniflora]
MNEVQLYTIVHFGGDIVRPKIRSIVSYVGGSAKLTSLREYSSYEDFVTLLEETSKICHEDYTLTTKSWTYFLEMLGYNFHGYDTRFSVISDRNPRIINVVPKVFPFAIHTLCAFHISNNIKTTLKSVRIAFRMATEALTSIDFDKHINAIHNEDPRSLIHTRYGFAYTNHVKSWNNVILKVRDLPIHVFIEELHRICSEMSYTFKEKAKKSQARLTPWAMDHYPILKILKMVLVLVVGGKMMGIPCEHRVRALGFANADPATRVSEYFTNNTYKAIYEPIWIPIRGIEQWKILKTDPRVCALIQTAQAGRPRTQMNRREKMPSLVTKQRF